MAQKNLAARIKWKRDTEANWASNNPVLLDGEVVIVDKTSGGIGFKMGDGVTAYSSLSYVDFGNTTYELTKSGSTITLTGSDGSTYAITDANTTYSVATTSAAGLMSSSDKSKLNGITIGKSGAWWSAYPFVGSDGVAEVGRYIDFHSTATGTTDYDVRLNANNKALTVQGASVIAALGFQGDLTGNAATATKLATARTISLTGDVTGSASFDGSGNVSIATTASATPNTVTVSIASTELAAADATVTKSVSGMTASCPVVVGPAPESLVAAASAGIYCSAQASGSLTFTAQAALSEDVTMNVMWWS